MLTTIAFTMPLQRVPPDHIGVAKDVWNPTKVAGNVRMPGQDVAMPLVGGETNDVPTRVDLANQLPGIRRHGQRDSSH